VEPSASAPPSPAAANPGDVLKDISKNSKRKKAKSKERSIEFEDRDRGEARDGDRWRDHDRVRNRDRTRDSDRARERDRSEGRIVERWIEREYDVPSDDRSGRRKRVIVIDRDSGRSARIERSEHRGDFFFGGGGFPLGF
jgi:hypothetical protein